MEAQHTPGPWTVDAEDANLFTQDTHRIWINADGMHIGYVDGPRNPERKANARLVAAAPELLSALAAIVEEADGTNKPYSSDSYLPPHLVHAARVAIANATRPGSWSKA